MWIATTESSTEVMEALLKAGADPNAQSKSVAFLGDTPLHMASLNGLEAATALLLRYGAKTTIRNAAGQTPIDVANENEPAIKQLLVRAANGSRS